MGRGGKYTKKVRFLERHRVLFRNRFTGRGSSAKSSFTERAGLLRELVHRKRWFTDRRLFHLKRRSFGNNPYLWREGELGPIEPAGGGSCTSRRGTSEECNHHRDTRYWRWRVSKAQYAQTKNSPGKPGEFWNTVKQ